MFSAVGLSDVLVTGVASTTAVAAVAGFDNILAIKV